MNDQYEECGWTSEKLADEELFIREVIREDTDLMLVDCLLREAFRRYVRRIETEGASQDGKRLLRFGDSYPYLRSRRCPIRFRETGI